MPGIDVREEPLFGDRAPTVTAREGSEPVVGVWPAVQRETPRERRFTRPGAGSELVSYRYKKAQ